MIANRTLHLALSFAALLAFCSVSNAQQPSDPWQEILRYTLDQPRTAPVAIELEIRAASTPEKTRAIEAKFIAILKSPAATADAKGFACRHLRQVGSEACIDAVAPLLADKDAATQARWALQSIAGEKSAAALREALPRLQGEFKAGVLQTIGARRDASSVAAVAPFAKDADPGIADAAIFALGKIGTADALAALQSLTPPDALKRAQQHAIILCAENLAKTGAKDQACAAASALFEQPDAGTLTRTAALRVVILADGGAKSGALIAAALKGNDPKLTLAAIRFAFELGGPAAAAPILAQFTTLAPQAQALVLLLAHDKAALPAALAGLQSADDDTRLAAITALGRFGDASAVAPLLGAATQGKPAEQQAARSSLRTLRGAEVEPALVAAAADNQPAPIRAQAIAALGARGGAAQTTLLLKSVQDADNTVRSEALAALGAVADLGAVPDLVALLAKANPADRPAIENAAVAIALRAPDREAAAGAILGVKLAQPAPDTRAAVLRIAGRIGAQASLAALRQAGADADPTVQDAAIRALADWPDPAAVEDLLKIIANASANPTHKVLAMRGLVRIARLDEKKDAARTLAILKQAMTAASRPEEKRLVLGALGDIKNAAALVIAAPCLEDPALEVEAATAIVRIARGIYGSGDKNARAAAAAIRRILDTAKSPQARKIAQDARIIVGELENIAPTGKASNPDGFKTDGQSGPPQSAIDGDPKTYFDAIDGQKQYRLLITLPAPQPVTALSIMGFEHHQYAPKDFEILADDKPIKKITNAQYEANTLMIPLETPTTCTTIEIRTTAYYGKSPAIRELGIYKARK